MTIDYRSEFSLLCPAGVAVLWTSSDGLCLCWWSQWADMMACEWGTWQTGERVMKCPSLPAERHSSYVPSHVYNCISAWQTTSVPETETLCRYDTGHFLLLTLTSPHLSSATCLQYSFTAGRRSRFQWECDAWVTGWPLQYPKPPRQPQSDEWRPRHHGNLGIWDVKGGFP